MSLETLLKEMRSLTLESGVKEDVYDTLPLEDLEQAFGWLQAVRNGEYFGVLEIKRLLPDHIWKSYELVGENNLREQKLLRERQKQLRKVWRTPYGKEKVKPKTDQKSASGIDVRPQEAGADECVGGSK